MQLKGKILIILVSVVLTVTFSYYVVFRLVILQSFIDLDRMDAEKDMNRCTAALNRELGLLDRFVHDWAAWDDTYRFVRDGNSKFQDANLQWEIFRDQKLNLIHIYNLKGNLVGGKTYDLKTGREIPLDLSIELRPDVFSKLISQRDENRSTTGIIQTAYGPLMISSNPILTSEVKGPSRGAILMGRFLNQDVIVQIADQVNIELSGYSSDSNKYGHSGSGTVIPPAGKVILEEEGIYKLIAYSLIEDIGGSPAFVLRASIPREIMAKGARAYAYGLMFILGGGIALLIVAGGLLQFLILRPVTKLTNNILAIGKGADRVEDHLITRSDELGTLSREFSSLIGKLVEREHTLKESEQRMSDIIDFLPDPTFAVGAEGKVIAWNHAIEDMTGVRKEEIIGKGDYAYAVPFYGEAQPLLLDLLLSPGEEIFKRYDLLHKIGDKLFVETFAPKLYGNKGAYLWSVAAKLYDSSGNVAGAIECIRDITERKQSEEILLRQGETIEQSHDGIAMTDLDGIVTYANPAWARMHGYTPDELKGKHLNIFHSESQYQGEVTPFIGQVKLLGGDTTKMGHLRKDGTVFTALTTAFILKDRKGSPVALISMARDISDEIRMEGQLRHAQKMEVIGQLAGGVAHDLNNMLAPILGYAEMILQSMAEDDPHYHGLFQILSAADRARNLTKQLLAFGSKQVLDMKTVDLNEVIESYSKMVRRTIREDIEIRIMTGQAVSGVQIDTSQIGQIILNLALNAQDAMPGGGAITIETSVIVLDEAYSASHQGTKPGEYVILCFSDNGTGMDKKTLGHMFEPFFTTKDRGKGTGLGLATVYGIVLQHKGHITVYSEPGIGSTFKIYLPRVEGEIERIPDKADIGKGKHGKETIIVAEDDEGVRDLTCEILRKHGYHIITAATAEEFIEILERKDGPIHLMLTDVIMPGMNGKQLYERIRKHYPDMKVLYMSGYTGNVIAHHGILEKGVHFIHKPFSIQALTEKIRYVLDAA